MKQLLLWLVVFFGLFALILYGLTSYNESAANKTYAKGQARAMIIEAQGQARLDSAQASAITQAANLPYVVLGLAASFGGIVLVLVVVILRQQQMFETTRIERIETRIIFLPQGTGRRQMWQMLSKTIEQPKMLSNRSKE